MSHKILQEEVLFVPIFYLVLRGRGLHLCIQRLWLEIGTDSSNHRYIRVIDEKHCPDKVVEIYLDQISNEVFIIVFAFKMFQRKRSYNMVLQS